MATKIPANKKNIKEIKSMIGYNFKQIKIIFQFLVKFSTTVHKRIKGTYFSKIIYQIESLHKSTKMVSITLKNNCIKTSYTCIHN